MPIVEQAAGGSGGSQPSTATATVTTDANTFLVSADFDLAHLTLVEVTFTPLSFVPDGETFGAGPGDLGVIDTGALGWETSLDGITWTSSPGTSAVSVSDVNGNLSTVGQFLTTLHSAYRYLRVNLQISNDQGVLYAGPNHPTATVRVDVVYL